MSKFGKGSICAYCQRVLNAVGSLSKLAATRDHVIPKCRGGRTTVWACIQCNTLKGSMMPDEWDAYMKANPEWWKKEIGWRSKIVARPTTRGGAVTYRVPISELRRSIQNA